MGSLFLKAEQPVMYIRYKNEDKQFKSVAKKNIFAPAGVVVNGYTEGSAEILALMLREKKGVKIYGQKTKGNTSVSEFIKLSDGPTLKLKIGEMLSANKKKVDGIGVSPNVVINGANNPANESSVLNQVIKNI